MSVRSIKDDNKENSSSNTSHIHHSKRKQDEDSLERTIEKLKKEIQNEFTDHKSFKKSSSNKHESSVKKYSE
jgi:hypothetical protein